MLRRPQIDLLYYIRWARAINEWRLPLTLSDSGLFFILLPVRLLFFLAAARFLFLIIQKRLSVRLYLSCGSIRRPFKHVF